MHKVIIFSVLFITTLSVASSASILEWFNWNSPNEYRIEKREDSTAPKSCACNGPYCVCCVDFNLTYIDLGGPGCVRMKYISQEEGILVNVSYGNSLLHSNQVKGSNPEPTCMSLLVNLAQICARFYNLHPENDGLRGCLLLEPKLLGTATSTFNIGCFTMGPNGMKLENTILNSTEILTSANKNNGTQSESEGLSEEELIAAVNESAEQSLVFFGNLLGLAFGKPETNETKTESVTTIPTSTHLPNNSRKAKLVQLSPKYNQL